MTPSASTSRSKSGGRWLLEELLGSAVAPGIVGCSGLPGAPEDADPGSGEDAGGVGVVLAAGTGALVDVGGPGAGEPTVGGEGGNRHPQAFVACPAEGHAAVLARSFGHRCDSGQRGDGLRVVENL